ncbi:UNVERIFIED_CONTAM: hypothetical protein K2H54_043915 [Gekko kuhli]
MKAEGVTPGSVNSVLPIAKTYVLPEETMKDLKVLLVDAPVVALHSGAVLSPRDWENILKAAMDRKNETVLKKAHKVDPLQATYKEVVLFLFDGWRRSL